MSNVDDTLKQRGAVYGDTISSKASLSQELKQAMRASGGWDVLPGDDMREALDMIATKISRILLGDPRHIDNWHDIAGYARLIEKALEEENVD